jgi:hypothetical protein
VSTSSARVICSRMAGLIPADTGDVRYRDQGDVRYRGLGGFRYRD